MTRRFSLAAAASLCLLAVAASGAETPKTLSAAAPGLWELTGVQGSKTPVRECVTNLALLGHYEHRTRSCTVKTLSDNGKVMVVNYSCGANQFGRTSIKVVTPRNLKIETQGIAHGLPFGYTIEARRVGECKAAGPSAIERGN